MGSSIINIGKKDTRDRREYSKRRYKEKRKTEIGQLEVLDKYLKSTFNISLFEYNELFTKQNGCCAICKKHQTEFKKRLAVDHCHKTGKIRGLLCATCNTALGQFKDLISNLKEAIIYLENHGEKDE